MDVGACVPRISTHKKLTISLYPQEAAFNFKPYWSEMETWFLFHLNPSRNIMHGFCMCVFDSVFTAHTHIIMIPTNNRDQVFTENMKGF